MSASRQLQSLALATAALACLAAPASARELNPEFSSRVWTENDTEVAAVCINGKEVLTFRARAGSGAAADEADDLALKLQEFVCDKSFDPAQLLPGHDGDKCAVKLAGNTALSFSSVPGKGTDNATNSLKLVNGLRLAMGAPALPRNFPDLSDPTAIASAAHSFSGQASWYGPKFHGRKTSDGHRFDMEGMTAAHRSLPFGTKLLVMNRKTGDSCVVEVNDRGPFIGNRVLDLSRGAARKLNMLGTGVAMVDCLVLGTTSEN